jgi:hypothetical protein
VPQAVRAAKNESVFRDVNERIRELQESFGHPGVVQFVCECSRLGCIEPVEAPLEVYGAVVRASPRRFLVAPGHSDPEVERIVLETDEYEIVEKLGLAGVVAEEIAS